MRRLCASATVLPREPASRCGVAWPGTVLVDGSVTPAGGSDTGVLDADDLISEKLFQ